MPPNDNPRKQDLAPLKELEIQPSTIETIDRALFEYIDDELDICLLYTSPSPRDVEESRMPSSA